MMLASWEDNPHNLERWPEAKRQAYLTSCPASDPTTSRADHREMGVLTEYLRTWPGAVRSTHPLFSYVALGARAERLLRPHPDQYSFSPDSPLARFCASRGQVLLLGPLFENVTLLHHAEHLADVPNKRIDRYRMPVLRNGERVWLDFEKFDTTNGIVAWPEEYFETLVAAYLAAGQGHAATVGHAAAYLFDGADLVRFSKAWMETYFSRTIRAEL